tara:strand:- start:45 stop:341 length:297 start_codon:yes stop_codon:yes gene_type:complete
MIRLLEIIKHFMVQDQVVVRFGVFLDNGPMVDTFVEQKSTVLGHQVYTDSPHPLAAAIVLVMRIVDAASKHVIVLTKFLVLVHLVTLLVVEIPVDVLT